MARSRPSDSAFSQDIDEPAAWQAQKQNAINALTFWNTFMDLRQGPDLDFPGQMPVLDSLCLDHLLCIVRAVSWVESQHGTGAGASAANDPMQCGNKNDTYWQELTGQITAPVDRFVGGPNANNYDAPDLPPAAANAAGFPANSVLTELANPQIGHDDPGFNSAMSYTWAVIFLVHKINTKGDPNDPTAKTYKCRDVATISDTLRTRFINGAVEYNGGGDAGYGTKIAAALSMMGCLG